VNYTIIVSVVAALLIALGVYWKYQDSGDMLKKVGAPMLSAIVILLFVGGIGTSLGWGVFPGMEAVPRASGQPQDITVQEPQTTSYAGVNVLNGLKTDTEITSPDTVAFGTEVPAMGESYEGRKSLDNYTSGSSIEIGAKPGTEVYVLVEESGYYSNYTDLQTGSNQFDFDIPDVNLHEIGSRNLTITDASISSSLYNWSGTTLQIDNSVTDMTLTLNIGLSNADTAFRDLYLESVQGGSWDNVGTLVQDPVLPNGVSVDETTGDFNLEDKDEGELYTDGHYAWPDKISINIQATGMDDITSGTLWEINVNDLDDDYGYDMQTGISEFTISIDKAAL
jgi:hypothetical protein